MKKTRFGLTTALTALLAGLASSSISAQETLFQESFETDGAGTRYTVQNPSDDGGSDFFARREERSVGTGVVGGAIDGSWMWAAQDLDADGGQVDDLEADEGRVIFNAFDITNASNMVITVAAGGPGNEVEFDNVLAFEYKIDGGEWIAAGGFRGTYTNSPPRYFEGDLRTFPPNTNPRLTRTFREFSWRVFETGSTMQIRAYVNANGGTEQYCFDNVRVTGTKGLPTLGAVLNFAVISEDAGKGLLQADFVLSQAAPAGGLKVEILDSDTDNTELNLPASFTIPGGATNYALPIEVLNDERFDGDELVVINFVSEEYASGSVNVTVSNIHAVPPIIMTEVYATPIDDDLTTDTNNDGVANDQQDEYVEIVNTGVVPVDLSGWAITDDLGPRHFFPEGSILEPGQACVVFGAGDPTGIFGGALVLTASTGNIAPSSADTMTLVAGAAPITSMTFAGDIGELNYSVTRLNELNPNDPIISLQTIPAANGALFTPGTRNDGTTFQTFDNQVVLNVAATEVAEGGVINGTVQLQNPGVAAVMISVDDMDAGQVVISPSLVTATENPTAFTIEGVVDGILDGDRALRLVATGDDLLLDTHRFTVMDGEFDPFEVVINEGLASIEGTATDFNGNGLIEEPVEDQFIEIVNNDNDFVNLAGWSLYAYGLDNRAGAELVHIFPAPTIIPAGGSIVVFGGGDEATLNAISGANFGGALIQVANEGGNGVNLQRDADMVIRLVTPDGHVEDAVIADGDIVNQGMSVTRNPDITGAFDGRHFDVSAAFELASAGRDLNGAAFPGNGGAIPEVATFFPGAELRLADGLLRDPDYGWFSVNLWPIAYWYTLNTWVYIAPAKDFGGTVVYIFDYSTGSWLLTSSFLWPLYYDYGVESWFVFGG